MTARRLGFAAAFLAVTGCASRRDRRAYPPVPIEPSVAGERAVTTPSVDYPAMGALLAADGLKACFRELAREEAGALVEVVVQLDVHGAVTDLAVSPSQWSGSRLEACVRDTLSAARGPGGEAVSVTLAFRSGPPNP